MKIGKLDLTDKLILAPMAEITDKPMRRICRDYGAGLTFTQMVSAAGVINNNITTLRFLVFNKIEKPIAVQILANNPSIVAEAVTQICDYKPDLIDLNAGCPAEQVCKVNMGSKLLDDPSRLGKLVKAMKDNAGNIPVSVKMRLGSTPKRINILENARICEDNGASVITVHGRTKADSYETEPDYSWYEKLRQSVSIPIIGNGSMFEPVEIRKLIKSGLIDSAMIARGALGNPFLFSRYNSLVNTDKDPGNPSPEDCVSAALRHLDYMLEEYGEDKIAGKSQKHLIWYFRKLPGITSFIQNISLLKNYESIKSYIQDHLKNILNGSYPQENIAEIDKQFNNKALFWLENTKADA